MARIVTLTAENAAAVAGDCAQRLLRGEIILFPTDTVYGLLLHSTRPADLARLNRLKGRAAEKPLAALLTAEPALVEHMQKLLKPLPGAEVERLVPGPVTLLAAAETWRELLPGALLELPYDRLGVRVPAHRQLQALLALCGGWVLATSANREGLPTPASAADCLAQLGCLEEVALVVDGGECGAEASAVVEVTVAGLRMRILRRHRLLPGE